MDDRPTIAAPDDDPHLWLEEVEGPRALDFVVRQSRLTLEKFGGAKFERDRDALAAIYDRPDNIPYIYRRRGLVYNLWKDDNNPRGLWRRTTLAEFRKAQPQWENVLDVDRLAADENADWLLNLTEIAPEGSSRAILSLSRGGSDAVTLREFDLDAKVFIEDGFVLSEAKGSAAWFDADTILLASAYGKDMATRSGYGRTIRRWRRGQPIGEATVICETTPDHMGLYCGVDRTSAAPRLWFVDMIDFLNKHVWLEDAPGGRSSFQPGVRTRTAPRLAGIPLGGGPAGAVDPRRIAAGLRGRDAGGQALDQEPLARTTQNRHRRCVAARP